MKPMVIIFKGREGDMEKLKLLFGNRDTLV